MQPLNIRWMSQLGAAHKACLKNSSNELNMSNYATGEKGLKINPALHQWPSQGERAWPLRKSTAHTRKREQWTNPRRVLLNNALSISAHLLAQPTIPAAQFPESQRYDAWCAPGHPVPITRNTGEENDSYGPVNIEPLTKANTSWLWQTGFPLIRLSSVYDQVLHFHLSKTEISEPLLFLSDDSNSDLYLFIYVPFCYEYYFHTPVWWLLSESSLSPCLCHRLISLCQKCCLLHLLHCWSYQLRGHLQIVL